MSRQVLGWVAVLLALSVLGFALFRKDLPGRGNSLLLATGILVGSLHSVLPMPPVVDYGTMGVSAVLSVVVLWRLIRRRRA